MSVQLLILKLTVQQNVEVLICKAPFSQSLRLINTKKSWNILVKNQSILQKTEMKHLSLNKNLWNLTISITRQIKMLTKKMKKEKEREIAEKTNH